MINPSRAHPDKVEVREPPGNKKLAFQRVFFPLLFKQYLVVPKVGLEPT